MATLKTKTRQSNRSSQGGAATKLRSIGPTEHELRSIAKGGLITGILARRHSEEDVLRAADEAEAMLRALPRGAPGALISKVLRGATFGSDFVPIIEAAEEMLVTANTKVPTECVDILPPNVKGEYCGLHLQNMRVCRSMGWVE